MASPLGELKKKKSWLDRVRGFLLGFSSKGINQGSVRYWDMGNQSSICNVFQVKAINYFVKVHGLGTGYFHVERSFSFYGFKN